MFEYTTRWWDIDQEASKPSQLLADYINETATQGWKLVSLSPWRFIDRAYDNGPTLAQAFTVMAVFEREKKD